MTDAELKEIQARADAVTSDAPNHMRNEAKVVLFIHAPADIRVLLEEVRRLRDELELERTIKRRNVGGMQETTKRFAKRIYELEGLARRMRSELCVRSYTVQGVYGLYCLDCGKGEDEGHDQECIYSTLLSEAAKLLGERQ